MPPPCPLFFAGHFIMTSTFHLEVYDTAPCCPAWPLNPLPQYWQGSKFWSEVFFSSCKAELLLSVPCCASSDNSSLLSFLSITAFFSLEIWHEFLRARSEGNRGKQLTLHPELSSLSDPSRCPQNKPGLSYFPLFPWTLSPPTTLPMRG